MLSLLIGWKVEGPQAVARYGRPPLLLETDRKALYSSIRTGKIKNERQLMRWVAKRKKLGAKHHLTEHEARKIWTISLRKCSGPRGPKRYSIPADYVASVFLRNPNLASALEKVGSGMTINEAAGKAVPASTLRYHADRATEGIGMRRRLNRGDFLCWCTQFKSLSYADVEGYFQKVANSYSSQRTLHRYLELGRAHIGQKPRRKSWTSGGSKHRGMSSLQF